MKLLYLKAKFQFLHFGNQFNLKMIYKGFNINYIFPIAIKIIVTIIIVTIIIIIIIIIIISKNEKISHVFSSYATLAVLSRLQI